MSPAEFVASETFAKELTQRWLQAVKAQKLAKDEAGKRERERLALKAKEKRAAVEAASATAEADAAAAAAAGLGGGAAAHLTEEERREREALVARFGMLEISEEELLEETGGGSGEGGKAHGKP